jgi:hypothetical protein
MALVLCCGAAVRAHAAEPAAPAPSPTPTGAIDLSPMDMGEPVAPRPQASPRPRRGSFTLTLARYRNDGSFATAADVQRYLGPAGERSVRAYVAAAYGRETYTTLIATSAPAEPPPKVKPKKPKPKATPPPIITPFTAADTPTETALGVEFRASSTVRFYVQGGPGNQRDNEGDLRTGLVMHAGAEWYRGWEPARPGAPYGYVDGALIAAAGPVANTALIFDAQRLHPMGQSDRSPELTLRVSAAADTRGRYFGNVAEVAAGVRFAPLGPAGPTLRLEAVTGQLGVGTALPKGMRRSYGALRPSISQTIVF